MNMFGQQDGAALEQRVHELERRLSRQQRLVRLLALAFLILTAVVLLPMILDVAGVLLMLAGGIFIVRSVADGAWERLFVPVRALGRLFRAV